MALLAPIDEHDPAAGVSPRERRQAKLRAEIFRVAVDLFAARGYDPVTVEEIARAVDIAKGTFFNYFPSKEHLLVEYRRELLDFIHGYGATLTGDSGRELIKRYYRKLARRIRSEGERYGMLFKEVVARPHLVTLDLDRQLRYRPHLERFIEIGKTAGEIPRGCDSRLLAETIRDLWTGASLTWLVEKPSGSLETIMMRRLDLLFDLFAAGSTDCGTTRTGGDH